MRGIIDIAIQDLRVFLRIRSNLVFTLVIPLVMTFIIGYVNGQGGGGESSVLVDVIDQDQSALSAQFIDSLRGFGGLTLCPMDNNTDDVCQLGEDKTVTTDSEWARARVQDGTSQAMIEIPADFGTKVSASESVSVTYVYKTEPTVVTQALDAAVLRVNGAAVAARASTEAISSANITLSDPAAFSQAVYDRADTLWSSNPVGVDYQQTVPDESSSSSSGGLQQGLGQSVPGIGAMFVMFTVFGGMTTLIQERKQWTLQRLGVMPVSKAQVLAGKILGRFILGIVQYGVVFIMGFLMGVNFGSDPLALILLIVLYTLSVTAFSFALGSRLQNESQASGLTLLLTMVLASIGGGWWPLDIVPEFMRMIGHISPVAWAMDGFNQLIFYGGSLSTTLIPIGVLLVLTLVFFAFSITRFSYD